MTIEQATVRMLYSLDAHDELAKDMIGISIYSVIAYPVIKRIVESDDYSENKLDDLRQVLDELEHMSLDEMVRDFLKI